MDTLSKQALSDEILLALEKPERYIGQEVNAVIKSAEDVKIRFAFAFPDLYEIGMSHLGIQILYDMFNRRDDLWCERVYAPWNDLETIMRREKIPLFALESQDPVRDFDFLGFTLQYEMCYTNVLQMIDLAGIPLRAVDRSGDDPIVIGGGPCAYNPEPVAAFFDLFYIGEGEVSYDALFDLYLQCREAGKSRSDFLRAAAQIPGIYVPSLYEVTYNADGTIRTFAPTAGDVPETVEKVIVKDLDQAPYPTAPVIPYLQATQDRMVLEVMRGCIRGCRFCQAGMVYRPLREKSKDALMRDVNDLIDQTGYDELSLSSLSTSDYSAIAPLMEDLMEVCPQRGVNISLPSLRIDAFSLDVMSRVQDIKKSSLTFAPEAGTQRMRDVINKGITEEEILEGAFGAFRGGWNKVKLYFMLGLPLEREEDVRGIAELCQKIAEAYYEIPKEDRMGACSITASCSYFVPKPFTPFQWAAMDAPDVYREKTSIAKQAVREQPNQRRIRLTYHAPDVSFLEGVLARGDRRLADLIETVYRKGARFDAWTECFQKELWDEAFADCGIDPHFYTTREREMDEILPWDFIFAGVTKEFLAREWTRAREEKITPNCRQGCSNCGARRYGGGVCHAGQG